ncbi:MAG TPA: hypothetical protein VI455_16935 [Terriglobia bacterium]
MPLISPKPMPPRKQTVALRLEISTFEALKRYAAFLGTRDLSHVVTGSLEKVFHADKEYKTWLKAHPDSVGEDRTRHNSGSNHHPAGSLLVGAAAPLAVDAVQSGKA